MSGPAPKRPTKASERPYIEKGRRLRQMREMHKESMQDIAALLNITRPHYNKCETGHDTLGRKPLGILAAHWGVSRDYLDSPESVASPDEFKNVVNDPDKLAWLRLFIELAPDDRIKAVRLIRSAFLPDAEGI